MICAEIMHLFTSIDLSSLNEMTTRAYANFNGGNETLPMTEVNGVIFLDASYGPTLAFKDVGQQIVAQLMNYYLSQSNRKANIMVDTSGTEYISSVNPTIISPVFRRYWTCCYSCCAGVSKSRYYCSLPLPGKFALLIIVYELCVFLTIINHRE